MSKADVKTIVLVRVTINDSLFVLCAISLSVCLYKVAKMSLANIYLESKVTHCHTHTSQVRAVTWVRVTRVRRSMSTLTVSEQVSVSDDYKHGCKR